MWAKQKHRRGFTIVELLIVIVVITVLATLTTVVYTTIQNKTKATTEINDIKTLNRALQSYLSENSSYPSTGGSTTWVGLSQAPDFIPGLTPKYIIKQPQQTDTSNGSQTSYIYASDGTDYKLLSNRPSTPNPQAVCSVAVTTTPAMADPVRSCYAFGIWSTGAAAW